MLNQIYLKQAFKEHKNIVVRYIFASCKVRFNAATSITHLLLLPMCMPQANEDALYGEGILDAKLRQQHYHSEEFKQESKRKREQSHQLNLGLITNRIECLFGC